MSTGTIRTIRTTAGYFTLAVLLAGCDNGDLTEGESNEMSPIGGKADSLDDGWTELEHYTIGAGSNGLRYSSGGETTLRYFRVTAGCHIEWIQELKLQRWTGPETGYVELATQLVSQESREVVYEVGDGPSEYAFYSWLVDFAWNVPLADDCEFVLWAADALPGNPEPTDEAAIDFCENGLDEDGDGVDRICQEPVEPLPVVRTVTIRDRGQNEGIVLDPPLDTLDFPGGSAAQLHLVNESVWSVQFSGNLTPGWLNPGHDQITMDVGVPGKITLSIPHESIVVDFVPQWPDPTAESVSLTGTFTTPGRPVMNATLEVVPEVGQQCIGGYNMADTIDACAGLNECVVSVTANLTLTDPSTGAYVGGFDFLTDPCNTHGETFRSRFSWTASNDTVSLWANWSNQFNSQSTSINLDGPPTDLTGTLQNVGGMSGELQLSF